jgi:hypothetical protein
MDSIASRIATEFCRQILGRGSWAWELGFRGFTVKTAATVKPDGSGHLFKIVEHLFSP